MVTVSIAPLKKLEAFKQRMGWDFKWVSSEPSDFNRDYHVSFTEEERSDSTGFYNYQRRLDQQENQDDVSGVGSD